MVAAGAAHPRGRLGDLQHAAIPERATRELKAAALRRPSPRRRPVTRRPAVSRVRVRYAETDKMGVVYYANYFVWFEVGRTDLLRELGLELSRDGSRRASRCR